MSEKTIAELHAAWREAQTQDWATRDILDKMRSASETQVHQKENALREAWRRITEDTEELSVECASWRVLMDPLTGADEAASVYVESSRSKIKLRVSDARTIAAWLTALADRVEGKA